MVALLLTVTAIASTNLTRLNSDARTPWPLLDPAAEQLLITNRAHLDEASAKRLLRSKAEFAELIEIHLKSEDVLHSFFLPNMRVKQDAVPGMTIPVWFRPMEIGIYDLPCAELCGWGHYKMKGRLTVESRERFDAWLKQKYDENQATQDTRLPAEK